jgi:coenzyme F420-reducing hydrogenase delta subunit
VEYARKKLEEVGINPERLEMYHIAASEGPLFARTAKEFTDRISNLMQEEKKEQLGEEQK